MVYNACNVTQGGFKKIRDRYFNQPLILMFTSPENKFWRLPANPHAQRLILLPGFVGGLDLIKDDFTRLQKVFRAL